VAKPPGSSSPAALSISSCISVVPEATLTDCADDSTVAT
jgi:hypothetical protein